MAPYAYGAVYDDLNTGMERIIARVAHLPSPRLAISSGKRSLLYAQVECSEDGVVHLMIPQ